jgi:hypothetical protein
MGFFKTYLVFVKMDGDDFIYRNTKTNTLETHKEIVLTARGNVKESKEQRKERRQKKFKENINEYLDSVKKEAFEDPKYETFAKPAKYNIGKKSGEAVFTREKGESPRSIVNKWSLIRYRGNPLSKHSPKKGITKEEHSKAQGVYKSKEGKAINPSARHIILRTSVIHHSPGYKYQLRDFIYTRYYGKIQNNQLLTLRRFAFPAEDNIIRPVQFNASGKPFRTGQAALATAVTWMGEKPGNSMKEILKFNVGFKWKEATSELQTINSQPRDRGKIGSFIDSSPIAQRIEGGLAGESATQTRRRQKQGGSWDPMKQTYPNHELAPLNIIKQVQVREAGLNFSQEFSLKFHYDLKGIPGVSPKIAFLDVLANLLVMTYNQAPFWGGAVRYTGGGKIGKPFGDLKKLQSGDIKGFMSSVVNDLSSSITKGVKDIMKGGDSKILNNVLGGAMMDLLGGPQGGEVAKAFLTGDPTGNWHLTIGNPLNPIAVIGNLICTDTEFSFDGPLGYEDFPSKLDVTIKLKPGRPRDKADIESMFNAGRGRLYIAEDGALDPSVSYDVDAYGKIYGDKNNNLARKAANFGNG